MKFGQGLPAETRRTLTEHDPRWPIKAALRVMCIPFAFLAMLMFAISISLTNKHFYNSDGQGDWTDGMCLAPVSYLIPTLVKLHPFSSNRLKFKTDIDVTPHQSHHLGRPFHGPSRKSYTSWLVRWYRSHYLAIDHTLLGLFDRGRMVHVLDRSSGG